MKSFVDTVVIQERFASRYELAQAIRDRVLAKKQKNPPYTLGEACHIVQLGVNARSLLGYREGRLVPYHHSLDREKRVKAEELQPMEVSLPFCNPSEDYVEDWGEVRGMLGTLLDDNRWARRGIPLSAVKALFRQQFSRELSETTFGHTKLHSFFQDSRMSEICKLEQEGTERFVRRAMPRSLQAHKIKCSSTPIKAPSPATNFVSSTTTQTAIALHPNGTTNTTPETMPTSAATSAFAPGAVPRHMSCRADAAAPSSSAKSGGAIISPALESTLPNVSSAVSEMTFQLSHEGHFHAPVLSWMPFVKRTFLEFPEPGRLTGSQRREHSAPAGLDTGIAACTSRTNAACGSYKPPACVPHITTRCDRLHTTSQRRGSGKWGASESHHPTL